MSGFHFQIVIAGVFANSALLMMGVIGPLESVVLVTILCLLCVGWVHPQNP